MKSRLAFVISLAALKLVCEASPSVAGEIRCPGSITETPSVSTADQGWNIVAGTGTRPLEHVGIYLGDPADYGAQIPDSTKRIGPQERISWRIVRAPADTFWVGCSYVGTTAMLFQKLDSSITLCVATYDLLPSGKRQRLSTLDCR